MEKMSDDWILRLSRGGSTHWVVGYKFDVNTAVASELAQDKVAMHTVLAHAGLPSVPHVIVRSAAGERPDVVEIAKRLPEGPVVIKPLEGTGGHGVRKYVSVTAGLEAVGYEPEVAWAVSPYCEVQQEFRLIVLLDRVLLGYEKTRPAVRHGLRYFNLGLGAVPQDITDKDLYGRLAQLARAACRAAAIRLAAVDMVRVRSGELLVLEVNDGIMMEHYGRVNRRNYRNAAGVYDAIVSAVFT